MMDEAKKTFDEVVAEMRDCAATKINGRTITEHTMVPQSIVLQWADELEAAAKRANAFHAMIAEANERLREHLQIALGGKQGDAAALREALMELMAFTCNSCERRLCEEDVVEEDGQRSCVPCGVILKARAALSAPARNCDVGTAEEQAERFHTFCHGYRTFYAEYSANCPFCDAPDINHCQAGWAQMPYAEGGDHA